MIITNQKGNVMKIVNITGALSALLCLAAPTAHATILTNWARAGIASQSSTYPGGDANKAIDGNISGWWTDGSITHTADSENTPEGKPWWKLDLQEKRSIAHLHIWFRDDCCFARNDNLRIVIFDGTDVTNGVVLWETNTWAWAGAVPRELGFDLSPPVNGRTIYVEHLPGQATDNFICISELEAFNQTLTPVQNHALESNGSVATSSSCYVGDCTLYGPQQAIDGNLHGATSVSGWQWAYSAPDNTAGVDPLPWWQVELQSPQSVGSIVLWPRRDRTLTRFLNIKLTAADQANASLYQQLFTIQPSGPKYVLNFVPALANVKTVKIETTDATPDKFLNLPEVQVFAPLASAPTITFTTNLQSITINENQVPTFGPVAVTVDAAIRPEDVSYRWFRNGVEIPNVAGSWLPSYTTPNRAGASANGDKYKVLASVSGHGVFSAEALLTVAADTTAPVLQYANGDTSMTKVRVWFSEPVNSVSAQMASNYQLSDGVTITSATLLAPEGSAGDNIVDLVTSPLTPGHSYTLTVTGVKDQSEAGNTVAPASTVQFAAWTLMQAGLLFEHYDNLNGAADADITTSLNDPRVKAGNPTTLGLLTNSFSTRNIFVNDSHEYYLARMTGYITPTETADYYFFLRADDAARFYLNTNANGAIPDPAVDTPICREPDCCGNFFEPDSGDPATTAEPIRLEAGKRYAVLALLKEHGGGDYLMVAWRKSTDSTAATDLPYLPAQYLSTYVDPNTDLQITKQPTDQPGVLPSAGIEVYSENFDTADGGFTVTNTDPAPPGPWVFNGTGKWLADGGESSCSGPYNSQLSTPPYKLTQAGALSVKFTHRYSFESGLWDAGLLRISVNGGPFTYVPAGNFTANGYAEGNIIGTGIAKDLRAFNGDSPGYAAGQFVTSQASLGNFSKDDTVVVQFVGAWDECTTAQLPGWEIDSVKLVLLPMVIQDFSKNNGSFTVANTTPPPPGPWTYNATGGVWAANGGEEACTGPYNSALSSPPFIVPVSDEATLSFTHRYSFENGFWDGGQVRVSVNGGAFTPVPSDSFSANGYAGNILGTGVLKDQPGFNGDSPGYGTNAFITSSAILGTFAQNDTIALQFVGAWDECTTASTPGWAMKNVQLVFGKAARPSTFTVEASATKQGQPMPASYQWQRDDGSGFVDIPNAFNSSYTIYAQSQADFDARFRAVVSVLGKSLPSNTVKLTEGAVIQAPAIAIQSAGGTITITYEGTLQSAPAANGPYQNVTGATSPYTVPNASTGNQFFRSYR